MSEQQTPWLPRTNTFQETTEAKVARVHPLKNCVKCAKDADPRGGVDLRGKWHCAKCWIKFMNGSIR